MSHAKNSLHIPVSHVAYKVITRKHGKCIEVTNATYLGKCITEPVICMSLSMELPFEASTIKAHTPQYTIEITLSTRIVSLVNSNNDALYRIGDLFEVLAWQTFYTFVEAQEQAGKYIPQAVQNFFNLYGIECDNQETAIRQYQRYKQKVTQNAKQPTI